MSYFKGSSPALLRIWIHPFSSASLGDSASGYLYTDPEEICRMECLAGESLSHTVEQ
jgi:hypothetical protein